MVDISSQYLSLTSTWLRLVHNLIPVPVRTASAYVVDFSPIFTCVVFLLTSLLQFSDAFTFLLTLSLNLTPASLFLLRTQIKYKTSSHASLKHFTKTGCARVRGINISSIASIPIVK